MIYDLFEVIYDLFQGIMNDINDTVNNIVKDKMGHNIVNDIRQIGSLISQAAYLLNNYPGTS